VKLFMYAQYGTSWWGRRCIGEFELPRYGSLGGSSVKQPKRNQKNAHALATLLKKRVGRPFLPLAEALFLS